MAKPAGGAFHCRTGQCSQLEAIDLSLVARLGKTPVAYQAPTTYLEFLKNGGSIRFLIELKGPT